MRRIYCCGAYWDSSRLENCPFCNKRLERVQGPEQVLVGESRSDDPQGAVEEAQPGKRRVRKIADAVELLRHLDRKIEQARALRASYANQGLRSAETHEDGKWCALTELWAHVERIAEERSDLPNE